MHVLQQQQQQIFSASRVFECVYSLRNENKKIDIICHNDLIANEIRTHCGTTDVAYEY